MRKLLLLKLVLLLVVTSCISERKKYSHNENSMSDTLREGVEAIIIDDIAFWNKKQLSVFKSNNWKKAQTPVSLKKGTKVFVLDSDFDTTFTKIMTTINVEDN